MNKPHRSNCESLGKLVAKIPPTVSYFTRSIARFDMGPNIRAMIVALQRFDPRAVIGRRTNPHPINGNASTELRVLRVLPSSTRRALLRGQSVSARDESWPSCLLAMTGRTHASLWFVATELRRHSFRTGGTGGLSASERRRALAASWQWHSSFEMCRATRRQRRLPTESQRRYSRKCIIENSLRRCRVWCAWCRIGGIAEFSRFSLTKSRKMIQI